MSAWTSKGITDWSHATELLENPSVVEMLQLLLICHNKQRVGNPFLNYSVKLLQRRLLAEQRAIVKSCCSCRGLSTFWQKRLCTLLFIQIYSPCKLPMELVLTVVHLFALNLLKLGCTSVLSHQKNTGDHPPVKLAPCHVPFALRGKVCQLVKEMLEQSVIKPSASPWASRVALVTKMDGSTWFYVDYRKLNRNYANNVDHHAYHFLRRNWYLAKCFDELFICFRCRESCTKESDVTCIYVQ